MSLKMQELADMAKYLPKGWVWDPASANLRSGLEWAKTPLHGQFENDIHNPFRGWVWSEKTAMWWPAVNNPNVRTPHADVKVVRVVDITNGDPVYVPTPEAVEADLRAWWNTTSEHDLEETIPKAVEYGSQSMIEYGRTLARVAGRKVDDADALEWAIYAYLVGKVGRWTAALQRGEKVSEDTLFDLEIYAKMVRKVRQTGTWT